MTKWEYMVIHIRNMSIIEETEQFNLAGAQGWELVFIRKQNAIFKRKVA